MKKLLCAIFLFSITHVAVTAQTRSDIYNADVELTWLGLDFTQVNFIGDAAQWQDVGAIDNDVLKDKYFVAWNDIFIDEKSKYDVAEAVNRLMVKYDIDITKSANEKSNRDYFVDDVSAYNHLAEADITTIISKYNFGSNTGIGLMFVVEGMNKETKHASFWVTFVDMGSKKTILTKRVEAKAGGFGFRNFWAKSFYNGLSDIEENLKKWSKGK